MKPMQVNTAEVTAADINGKMNGEGGPDGTGGNDDCTKVYLQLYQAHDFEKIVALNIPLPKEDGSS